MAGGSKQDLKLYTALGIEKDADLATIKKRYKRLALQYHPDKNPNNLDKFNEIKHAYDILGDENKRKVYDKYGEQGLRMMESMGPMFDANFENKIGLLFLACSLVTILLIIFLSFLSSRVEGSLEWNYSLVFVPLWILDLVTFFALLSSVKDTLKEWRTFRKEGVSDDVNEDNNHAGMTDTQFALVLGLTLFLGLYLILSVVFQVLIVLKVDGTLPISATLVFIPIYIMEGLVFIRLIVGLILYFKTSENLSFLNAIGKTFETFWFEILRVAQIVLLVLKLDNLEFTSGWAVIFIPFYLLGLKYLLDIVYGWFAVKKIPNLDARNAAVSSWYILIIVFVIGSILGYAFLGLLINKLDAPDSISLVTVFIPFFLVFSFILCCCGACLPCCFYTALRVHDLDDHSQPGTPNDPNRRITQGLGEDFAPISIASSESYPNSSSPLNPSR